LKSWGATDPSIPVPVQYLREVALPILIDERCEQVYGSRYVKETMICAGEVGDGVDTCQGDSGGPLIVPNEVTGVSELVGITSWGVGCGNVGVYTRVQSYISWILGTIQNN
jgi:secreted trypsin-like serine protease